MKFLLKICLIIFILSVDTACAQAEKKTLEIFDRVVNSIGNNFNGVPKIEIVNDYSNPGSLILKPASFFAKSTIFSPVRVEE